MEFDQVPNKLIEETQIVGTLITRKPNSTSFIVASTSVLFIGLVTLIYWQNPAQISRYLVANRDLIFNQGQWWRAFTAVFIHNDLAHYLSNMYMLAVFSYFINSYFGFYVFPILSVVMAAVVNVLSIYTYTNDIQLLGASGLVYFLGGFWLSLYFLIQRQYNVGNRILRVLGIGLVIFFPTSFVPNVSYRTHAIGIFLGILVGSIYFFKNKKTIQAREIYKRSYVEPLDV
jgi:rhomboid protease GluP